MRYYKITESGYVVEVGIGFDGVEISKTEYDKLFSAIIAPPQAKEGYGYRLREDLTWEEYQLPIIDPVEEEISDEEALAIILGGEV